MKLARTKRTDYALTLVEVLVVIAIVAVLFAMIDFGPPKSAKMLAYRISCLNNLKQVGLAYRVWAGDNNDKYPMEISTTNGGTMELLEGSDAWKTFQVMSNELSTAKVLFCPGDLQRTNTSAFGPSFSARNISYFIGTDATVTNGNALLSGDDNFLLNQSSVHPGLVIVTSPAQLAWDGNRHGSVTDQGWFNRPKKIGIGNIALTDGSVQVTLNSGLTNYLSQTGLPTNRLVIP